MAFLNHSHGGHVRLGFVSTHPSMPHYILRSCTCVFKHEKQLLLLVHSLYVWLLCLVCRKLAHGSSVDAQGRDTDVSVRQEEVHIHVHYVVEFSLVSWCNLTL